MLLHCHCHFVWLPAAGWSAEVRDNMKQSQPDYSLQLVIRGPVTPSCCPAPTAATRAELAI